VITPSPRQPADLTAIRLVVLDMDGTLYRDQRLFDATLPFLERLRRLGIGRAFLTNNTSLGKADYVEKLRRFGIDASENDILTPADTTIAYLRRQYPQAKALTVLGTPSLCRQFTEAGFHFTWDAPQAVVVGFDTTLTYERLCRTAYWISTGLPFVATHPDLVCPTGEPTVLVDCGSICACLSAATGRRPVVLGKPEPEMLWELGRRHGLNPSQMAMVGDRLYTDIAMAQRAGVLAVLVLTGEATAADAAKLPRAPDLVLAHIGEFGEQLEQARGTHGAAPARQPLPGGDDPVECVPHN
jgi:HAD superfamily hydrolase (TIGR01450 family)